MKIKIPPLLYKRFKIISRNTQLFLLFIFTAISIGLLPQVSSAEIDLFGLRFAPPDTSVLFIGPTATNTPAGPTATSTDTPTNTPIPPTATSTNTPAPPTATNTPAPPTATNTPAPPTATSTNTPLAIPTSTQVPVLVVVDSFALTQIRENQVQLTTQFDSDVTVVAGGGSVSAAKTYDIVLQFQNTSPANAPAVLANLVIPSGMSVSSIKWDKTGNWYSDGALSRTCSFDGRTAYCGIGQLWSGMKVTITLRVSAEPGQYSLSLSAEELSALYEVPSNNRSIILVTLK